MMNNKDYVHYLVDLQNSIFKILPLCEENDPNISQYIDSVLFETKGLFGIIPSSKTSVWHLRTVSKLNNMCNNYSTEQLHDPDIHGKEIRREILSMLNEIDKEIKYYRELVDKEADNHELYGQI